ncbi:MAG: hypothetical protein A4E49_02883 [Methanosaeta sp. PtaU1.Bin112]|nr:MAG: hypothetical protein A4E49_02883 [Methanosaeta sp. PtaU1.Bin112]
MKDIPKILAVIFLLYLPVVLADDISADQLKQMMTASADNLTAYTYNRSAESTTIYSNESLHEKFAAMKDTEGRVNLTAQSGWWSHRLTDNETGEVLTWQGYFSNGTEYWKEKDNWTQFIVDDPDAIMADYNELPSQVSLLYFSNLSIIGAEVVDGDECYVIAAEPIPLIREIILGTQIYAAYLSSPFSMPDEFDNNSFDLDNTSIQASSNISVTAWVSKETSLIRRIEIDSRLSLSPSILDIEEPDFSIQSTLKELTDYGNFGKDVQIVLPGESEKNSPRTKGVDWRWAVFGLVEP